MGLKKSELAQRVATNAAAQKTGEGKTMDEYLRDYESEFAKALPARIAEEMGGDRFLRLALNELRWEPALRQCDPYSVIGAMMTCAQLGLEPSGPLNHVSMVPFNRNVGTKEQPHWIKSVQLIVQYHGYRHLAERAGIHIQPELVYEGEDFRMWRDDKGQHVSHHYSPFGREGRELVGAYAQALMPDGHQITRAVGMAEILKAKAASKSGRDDKGPWFEWFEQMARKTAIRRLWTELPKNPEMVLVERVDNRAILDVPKEPILDNPAMLDQVSEVVDVVEVQTDELPIEDGPPDPIEERANIQAEKAKPYTPDDPERPFE
jgi:recombination protein RecT